MEQIPTAEKFFMNNLVNSSIDENGNYSICDIKESMIEFAKLHVEAQKKHILKNVKTKKVNSWGGIGIDKDSILNSYPLEKIK
jgi:hypothetical protein